jgi:hypothetical protein
MSYMKDGLYLDHGLVKQNWLLKKLESDFK